MSNALRYIKDLEAAGFQRSQAEAQVQMVLDVIEGELVTKSDFLLLRNGLTSLGNDFVSLGRDFTSLGRDFTSLGRDFASLRNDFTLLKNDLGVFKEHVDNRFSIHETNIQNQMDLRFSRVDSQIKDAQFKTVATLGTFGVGLASIVVGALTWLIKI